MYLTHSTQQLQGIKGYCKFLSGKHFVFDQINSAQMKFHDQASSNALHLATIIST